MLKLTEGWNYPLQDILRVQWQMLEERTHDFLNGVTGALSVQASLPFKNTDKENDINETEAIIKKFTKTENGLATAVN